MRMKHLLFCCLAIFVVGINSFVSAQPANLGPSDQKAGSVLVFPYVAHKTGAPTINTKITISNASSRNPVTVHLVYVNNIDCTESNINLMTTLGPYLTPNATYTIDAADYFTDLTGYLIAIAIDENTGCLVQNNVLLGHASVNIAAGALGTGVGALVESYNAQAFFRYNNVPSCQNVNGNVVLNFDGVDYDRVPSSFWVQLQRPSVSPGQSIVTAGLNGSLVPPGSVTSGAWTGIALMYDSGKNRTTPPPSRSSSVPVFTSQCFTQSIFVSPFAFGSLGAQLEGWLLSGYGSLRFNIGAGVGLLMTPKGPSGYAAITPLHWTQLTNASLEIYIP